jgi:hypothetical protein
MNNVSVAWGNQNALIVIDKNDDIVETGNLVQDYNNVSFDRSNITKTTNIENGFIWSLEGDKDLAFYYQNTISNWKEYLQLPDAKVLLHKNMQYRNYYIIRAYLVPPENIIFIDQGDEVVVENLYYPTNVGIDRSFINSLVSKCTSESTLQLYPEMKTLWIECKESLISNIEEIDLSNVYKYRESRLSTMNEICLVNSAQKIITPLCPDSLVVLFTNYKTPIYVLYPKGSKEEAENIKNYAPNKSHVNLIEAGLPDSENPGKWKIDLNIVDQYINN